MVKLSKKLLICTSLIILFSSIFLSVPSFSADTLSPEISSPAVILIDYSTGKILYEKNMHEKRYPASLTKVMTAIIVLEKCELDEIATVSNNAVSNIPPSYVTAFLQEGEQFTVEQLLYLLLIPSANDAAVVLAEHVVGGTDNISEFFVLMNKRARDLGCKNTNFTNPSGIHDEAHYSTAYDLALIGQEAMKSETFRTIVSATRYELPPTDLYENSRRFSNSNLLLNSNSDYYYRYSTGIKTGYTRPAGNCLIASASRNKLELITVTLGSEQTENGLSERYLDTLNLFKYGYDAYAIKEISKKGQVVQTINVRGASYDTKRLDISLSEDVSVLIKKANLSDTILPNIVLHDKIKAPIQKDDILGTITYSVEGITYTYDLIASSNVEPSSTLRNILILVAILLLLGSIRYVSISKGKNPGTKKQTTKKKKKKYIQY